MISGRNLHSFYADISRHLVRQTQNFFQPKRTKSLSLQQTEYHCEVLKNRSLIKLTGSETLPFLQGLVTNDVRHLVNNHQTSVTLPCLYAPFLNQQGRVLYDTILYNISNSSDTPTFLVECDSSICGKLITHLKIYKIRKKIDIAPMVDKLHVWSLFTLVGAEKQSLKERQEVLLKHLEEKVSPVILTKDPRCAGLGFRCIVPPELCLSDVLPLSERNETAFSEYTQLRYKVGIGEGVCDHPPEKCFPLECNMDFLHGVSFYKGCYIGQELTARTQHTGVVRKRLMPIRFVNEPTAKVVPETVILNENGVNVGKFRSHQGRYGLALLRVEESLASRHFIVKGTDIELSTKKPFWWPQESVKSG